MKKLMFYGFLFLLISNLIFPVSKNTDREKREILSTVNNFFKVIETRDLDLAKKIMIPGGNYFSIRGKGESQILRVQTYEQFIKSISEASQKFKEVIHNPRVLMHRDIAVVWAKYTFFINDELSHRGVDAFSLIKIERNWKIAGIVYTVEKDQK